jgi:hypothetical protein
MAAGDTVAIQFSPLITDTPSPAADRLKGILGSVVWLSLLLIQKKTALADGLGVEHLAQFATITAGRKLLDQVRIAPLESVVADTLNLGGLLHRDNPPAFQIRRQRHPASGRGHEIVLHQLLRRSR